jgi:predicted metal-dependent phosphoesterase TrpH
MIVEMHCHTAEHSPCSHVAAVDLVRRLCEAGVQTVVLTDHHYQWSEEELADLRRRAQLPEVCRILAGQEIETYDFGHLLIYGAQATIPAMRLSLLQIREQYRRPPSSGPTPTGIRQFPTPTACRTLRSTGWKS